MRTRTGNVQKQQKKKTQMFLLQFLLLLQTPPSSLEFGGPGSKPQTSEKLVESVKRKPVNVSCCSRGEKLCLVWTSGDWPWIRAVIKCETWTGPGRGSEQSVSWNGGERWRPSGVRPALKSRERARDKSAELSNISKRVTVRSERSRAAEKPPLLPASTCFCLLLPASACFYLLLPASTCFCLLLPASSCFCLLLPASACFFLLLPASVCFCLLLPASACFCLLLSASACFFLLLPASVCFCLLLPASACFYLLLPASTCFCLLLPASSCFYLLLPASACFFLLLPASTCFCLLLSASVCFCLLLPASVCFYLLLPASACFYLLLPASACFYLLLPASACFCLLLPASACFYLRRSQPQGEAKRRCWVCSIFLTVVFPLPVLLNPGRVQEQNQESAPGQVWTPWCCWGAGSLNWTGRGPPSMDSVCPSGAGEMLRSFLSTKRRHVSTVFVQSDDSCCFALEVPPSPPSDPAVKCRVFASDRTDSTARKSKRLMHICLQEGNDSAAFFLLSGCRSRQNPAPGPGPGPAPAPAPAPAPGPGPGPGPGLSPRHKCQMFLSH
ncbi:uncharacterized protein V6R79_001373 [Siganus canaliculatus]